MRKGTINLPDTTWTDLHHLAKQLNTTTADLLRQAATDLLKGHHTQRLDDHELRITALENHPTNKPPT